MKNKITEEWFERGKHDFETAKLIFRQKGYFDVIILLLQQAIEKYIKGYLIFNGWELKKIHDIETLLTEVIQFDKTFEDYLDLGRRLTAYYYESRYPPEPIPEISKQEIKDTIKATEEIIAKLRIKVKS